MEAYAGKQFVGIDLHGEQVKYPKVGLGQPTVLVDADTYGGWLVRSRSPPDEGLDLVTLALLAPEVCAGLRVLTVYLFRYRSIQYSKELFLRNTLRRRNHACFPKSQGVA